MSAHLINMQMSKKDAKNEFGAVDEEKGPRFPHGLTLNLNDMTLKKLGISTLPDVGTEMLVVGVGKVSRASENRRQGGVDRDVSIQLESLDVGPLKKKKATAVDAVSDAVKDV